jgi:lipopolysaccharide/colanic/teichoic acid biosynthesis glycosyltransferase
MTRSVKLLAPLVTVAVVLGSEVVHALFIGDYPVSTEPRFAWILVLTALILVATYAVGVNDPVGSDGSHLLRAASAVGGSVVLVSVLQLVTAGPLVPRFVLGVTFVVLTPALALLASLSQRSLEHRSEQERVIALVGEEESERLKREMGRVPERPAYLCAVLDPLDALPYPDNPVPLARLVEEHRATLIVLDRAAQALEEIVSQAAVLHGRGIRIRTLSLFYDEWLGRLPISELERIAILFDINEIHRPVYARMKRFLDVLIAIPGILALALAVPVVAVVDLFGNRGPLFYRQERVGKGGEPFTIIKFRTMTPHAGTSEWTTAHDPRLTPTGRLLRRLHVDELPQVWNVLRRDLSFVGPRPEQPRYVEQLSDKIPFYDVRHLVRPGITGWAQVKYGYGADELDALEKLQYEFYYLRHQSVVLDLRIIGRTLRSVVQRQGR